MLILGLDYLVLCTLWMGLLKQYGSCTILFLRFLLIFVSCYAFKCTFCTSASEKSCIILQDPVLCSVTVGVSHFEKCGFWVQVLYYPFYGSGAVGDYEGDYAEEDPQIIRQKRSLRPELGEPVILRCQPYKIPLTELLLPHKISPVEFFRLWPSLPAIVEYTGTYIYEGSGFKATAAQQYGSSPFLSGLKSLYSKPFHRVCSHIIRTVAGFQVVFNALISFLSHVCVDLSVGSLPVRCFYIMKLFKHASVKIFCLLRA